MTRRRNVVAPTTNSTSPRHARLRQLLEANRDRVRKSVADGLRTVRDEGSPRPQGTGYGDDAADVDAQDDVSLALIELQSETSTRIDEALSRLASGTYGHCQACGEEIAEARLQALPFAVRCMSCEEERETSRRRGAPRTWQGWSLDRVVGE